MNFGFTPEQEQLRDQLRRFLDDRAPLSQVRQVVAAAPGFSRALWQEAAALGWLGLIVPEEHGGLGLGWVDVLVVLEETGRSLFPSPFISHTLAQSLLVAAGSEAQKRAHLPGWAGGERIAVPALLDVPDVFAPDGVTLTGRVESGGFVLDGAKRFVADADAADVFLVAFRPGTAGDVRVAIVERNAPGVTVRGDATMDATKRTGTLGFAGVRVAADALLPAADFKVLAQLLDRGAVAVTAEAVGAMERLLAITSGYAKARVQFGELIGRYQGVKHRLAEIHVDIESVKSLVYYAAWCCDHDAAGLPRAASLAKAYASESFPRIGIDGVQLHGAIGYTADYDIQLYLKRAKWVRPMFGDAEHHYERAFRIGTPA